MDQTRRVTRREHPRTWFTRISAHRTRRRHNQSAGCPITTENPCFEWRRRAAALAAVAGLAVALLASPAFAQNDPADTPAQPTTTGRAQPDLDLDRARDISIEARRRELDRVRSQMEGASPDEIEALRQRYKALGFDLETINADAAVRPGLDPNVGVLRAGDGDATVSLDFEAMDLQAFSEFVSNALAVVIFADEELAGIRVRLNQPLDISNDKLLPLLGSLVAQYGFTLTYDDLGFYTIKRQAAGALPISVDGPMSTTRVIATPNIAPSAIPLAQLMGQSSGTMRITPIDELGVLIVTAPPGDLRTAEMLVAEIMKQFADQTLYRFQLFNVSADYAIERILTLNGQVSTSNPVRRAGTQVMRAPGGQAAGASSSGGGLSNLGPRLFTDQGNAVIFKGTEAEYESVARYIELVDVVTPLRAHRYVAGSVAMDIATAGERLGLGAVVQSGSGGSGSGVSASGARGIQGGFGPIQPTLSGSGFLVDIENGTLIYFGTDRQHELVANLVAQFQEQAILEVVEIRAYKLHHSDPESVAGILTELIADPGQQQGRSAFFDRSGAGGGGNPDALLQQQLQQDADADAAGDGEGQGLIATSEDTIIVADPDRRQILIRASARAHRQFERLIGTLDERLAQVSIDAKIVSITTTDDFDWSIDAQLNVGQFATFTSFGLSTAGAAGFADTRTPGTGLPGFNASLIKSDFLPFVIRALQEVGETRLISNPNMMVNDNSEATLESQREEPFSSTSQGTSTTIVSQGGVAEAGTTLTVTPHISEGGYLILDYAIELSDFTGAASNGLQPPAQRDNYTSSVTIPSGMTVVVGGFVLETDRENERKVPFLGDLPLIGAAFKSIDNGRRRTTIYVFITPTILDAPLFDDLDILSQGPADAMDIERVGMHFEPAVIPAVDNISKLDAMLQEILPAVDPTAADHAQRSDGWDGEDPEWTHPDDTN